MVAAGIGAGIVIIILEILYHKHRGWKEEQKELAKKTTDKWRANIMMMKKERTTNGQQPNGVLDSHAPQNDGIARRNPIYNPENHVDSTFTYNWAGVRFVCDFLYAEHRMIFATVVDENMKDAILTMHQLF